MKLILITEEKDFTGEEKKLSTLKPYIGEFEPPADLVLYINNEKQIRCFKNRNGKVGIFNMSDLLENLKYPFGKEVISELKNYILSK